MHIGFWWERQKEENRSQGRPRRRWENNIEMKLREIGLGGMDWIRESQDRDKWRALVNTVMNLWIPLNARKFLSSSATCGCLRRTQVHGVSELVAGIYKVCTGGNVNILGGHSIGHSEQNNIYICTCVLFRTVSEIELFHFTVHCTDEQHDISPLN
jgi:hypothetical protein